VGKAPGQYLMLLGGGFHGERLNKIYKGMPYICFPLCGRKYIDARYACV
jgi:hypothetical protein